MLYMQVNCVSTQNCYMCGNLPFGNVAEVIIKVTKEMTHFHWQVAEVKLSTNSLVIVPKYHVGKARTLETNFS